MLKNLRIWQKLALIVLVMATGIPVIFYLIQTRDKATIDFGQAERYGCEYLVPAQSLLSQALHLRDGLAAGPGAALMQKELEELKPQIQSELTELEAVDQRLGSRLANNPERVPAKLQTLQQDWTELQERADADLSARFVRHILEFITQVGDSSNLILDPDIDSYYLMAAVIYQIPPLADDLGALRSMGEAIAEGSAITLDQRLALAALAGRVQLNLDALQKSMKESAFVFNPGLEPEITPALSEAATAVGAFLDLVRQRLMQADPVTLEPKACFHGGTLALEQVFRLYDTQLKNLDRLLELRLQRFRADRVYILGAVVAGILLVVLLSGLISRAVLRQINAINEALARIDRGDYAARVQVTSRDELGQMANSLNAVLDHTVSLIQSREEQDRIQRSLLKLLDEVSGVASGDLTIEAEVTADITGAIADAFNLMLDELRQLIGAVQDAALKLSSSTNEIQATADHLSKGSASQAEQIVDTSAGIDEMASSIQKVSESANLSATVARQSLDNANQGAEAVRKTIEGMDSIRDQVGETAKRVKRLGESSQEIGEIIKLIGDIADRTSILALNASIQAAMAGEAGRGFAIVAEEVERLAVRSTEATKRVATLVKTIQAETGGAVAAMESTTSEVVRGSQLAHEAGEALEKIGNVSNQLADLIQSISLASKQQARGSEALAKSMSDISSITQQTATSTKQAAASIGGLKALADELRESVSRFKLSARAV
jgi:twitching motility protein PilJ